MFFSRANMFGWSGQCGFEWKYWSCNSFRQRSAALCQGWKGWTTSSTFEWTASARLQLMILPPGRCNTISILFKFLFHQHLSHQHLPDLLMNLEEVSSGWWSIGPIGQMVHWSLCGLGPTPTQHYPHHDHLTTWGSNNIWPAALSVRETVSSMVNWFSFGHQTNDWGKPLNKT